MKTATENVLRDTTLQAALKRDPAPWPPARVVPILREMALRLNVLHSSGMTHGGLTPRVVSFDANGLASFDEFARHLSPDTGQQPVDRYQALYRAPEQALGEAPDKLSDLYALGIICYELVTGQPPFTGATPEAVERAHCSDTLKLPSQHTAALRPFDEFLERALQRDPKRRFHRASDMASEFEVALQGKSHLSRTPVRSLLEESPASDDDYSPQKPSQSNPVMATNGRASSSQVPVSSNSDTADAGEVKTVGWVRVSAVDGTEVAAGGNSGPVRNDIVGSGPVAEVSCQPLRRRLAPALLAIGLAALMLFLLYRGWTPRTADNHELIAQLTAEVTGKFVNEDFKSATKLLQKLRDGKDPVSRYVRDGFSPRLRQDLKAYKGSTAPDVALRRRLVHELNRLLQDKGFNRKERFAGVALSPTTRSLAQGKPPEDDLAHLNRSLLEDAYPQEIKRYQLRDLPPPGSARVKSLTSKQYSDLRYKEWEYKVKRGLLPPMSPDDGRIRGLSHGDHIALIFQYSQRQLKSFDEKFQKINKNMEDAQQQMDNALKNYQRDAAQVKGQMSAASHQVSAASAQIREMRNIAAVANRDVRRELEQVEKVTKERTPANTADAGDDTIDDGY